MLSIVSGVVVFGAGGTGLWYFSPRSGITHPIATKPLLDSLVPVGIVSALAIGTAMILSGFVGA